MRVLYQLAEMPGLLDPEKNIAVIGDGPSKLKYIFARRNVYTFAINRAAIDYPADFAVCVPDHLDQMLGVIPRHVPLIYINNFDMIDLEMREGGKWTATIFFRWLMAWVGKQRVYLQGFDFTGGSKRYDGLPNEYEVQAGQFLSILREHPDKAAQVSKMKSNSHLDFIQTRLPERNDIL